MSEVPESVKVSVTVLEKSIEDEERGQWKLSLDVPDFKSQFPTYCTRVPEALAKQFKVRGTYTVELHRQAVKKDKAGVPKTGQYYSDYYWGLAGLVSETPASAGTTPGEGKAPMNLANGRDSQRASIEAQVALKEAAALIRMGNAPLEDLELLTWRCYWAMQHAQEAEAPNTGDVGDSPPSGSPRPQAAPSGPAKSALAPAPTPQLTQGDVMQWARSHAKGSGDVLDVLSQAGWLTADGGPLRAMGDLPKAKHPNGGSGVTPQMCKDLCAKAWGLAEEAKP